MYRLNKIWEIVMIDLENFIKQFDTNKQVSLTGARTLVLLIALLHAPMGFEEIIKFMHACGIVSKDYSIDTIRIDINTLKTIGCDISKATKNTQRKYHLYDYPFRLRLTEKEIDILKAAYKVISANASPETLLEYHKLFAKMAEQVKEPQIKEELYGISILKGERIDLIEELVSNETKHNKVKILYSPGSSKEPVEYDITVEKLGIRSGKLYVYCYNHSLGSRSFLNVSRINSVIATMFDRSANVGFDSTVNFKLKNYKEHKLEDNEYIIEANGKEALIEGQYYNSFIAMQRMLSLASDCTVIAPEELKITIINKLKEMRALYE